ncbi:MAG: S8 family serine peptidase [Acidobacteriia bacterium]|nr:S8 family serine peptidase [Terriglobia bacterium]
MPFFGTGEGLKIAVIDSGVNAKHPHIHAVTEGVVFGSGEPGDSSEDVLGHGTAVMAAIQEKAPAAEYYALRLFSNSLRTTTTRLIEAIDWAISNRMDIVNLSLGTPKLEYRKELEALVERAEVAGTLIVAARQAGEQPVLPGILPGVISAGVDWEIPRHHYYPGDGTGPSFFASGYPRPLPGMPVRRNLHGISFAVANLSGIIARAVEGLSERSFESVSRLLISNSRS